MLKTKKSLFLFLIGLIITQFGCAKYNPTINSSQTEEISSKKTKYESSNEVYLKDEKPGYQLIPEPEKTYVSFAQAREDAKQTEEKIKNKVYANFRGEISINMTDADEISVIELNKLDYDVETLLEKGPELFKKFNPDLKDDQIFLMGYAEDPLQEKAVSQVVPEIREGSEEYKKGDVIICHGDETAGEMVLFWNGLSRVSRGGMQKYLLQTDKERVLKNPAIQLYSGEYYDLKNGNIPDEQIKLEDGTLSIKDAIALFEQDVNQNYYLEGANPDILYDVYGVQACELPGGAFAYKIYARETYNGIAFNTTPKDIIRYTDVIKLANGKFPPLANFTFAFGNAMIIKRNEIESYADCNRLIQTNEVGDPITRIIPISKIVEELSNILTDNITIDILSIELIYIKESVKNDYSKNIAYPMWKIYTLSNTDQKCYDFYISPITGELWAVEME
ncbi:hypothetical protein [Cuneatibacter caecimuris]|uniref:Uncharacterized protein n=1 Tax=Cuneatibacter caecimuris TaxID=1796618 RepID=A0A4Q7P3J5_9FIRM|nr:hypothetical protein [Cuneatibacter caecimuris]RZS94501.1 hypothetical protein EV209_2344 [Cuneatibacter caecimuris]